MNVKKWISEAINLPHRLAVPIMTHPGIEIIGKRVVDAVTDGEVHAEAIIALDAVYPSDAPTVIMDLTVEAEAFGSEIRFKDNEMPDIIGRLVTNYAEVEALQLPSLNDGRLQEYLKANKIVAQRITDKLIFGGCIGPFSLAGRLFDLTELMMAIYTETDTAILLLEKCTEFLKIYIQAIKDQGVGGVIIAEPAAGLLSNDDAMEYSTQYVKQIVDELQDDTFMIVLHNCGNTGHCTESMYRTGAAAVHFGNKIDMVEALKECPSDILVMGNIDPVSIIQQGTSEEVAKATRGLIEKCAEFPNFVISTGCDVPPGVSEENIMAFYGAVKS